MVENPLVEYITFRSSLNDTRDVDSRTYNEGNVAVVGLFFGDLEIITVLKRKEEFSLVYLSGDGETNVYKITTKELARFLEVNLKHRLDHGENPANMRAFVGDVPNMLGGMKYTFVSEVSSDQPRLF